MKAILGQKVGMTQIWDDSGRLLSATLITAAPNKIIAKADGRTTIATTIRGKTKKAQRKIADLFASGGKVWQKTLNGSLNEEPTVGQFVIGEKVTVTGITKGKGFAGGVKRHGFAGSPSSHGHSHQRRPGSIGAQRPQRVVKGQKMAGHMGAEQFTSRGGRVLFVNNADNLLVISGAVPGPKKGRVFVKSQSNNSTIPDAQ